MMLVPDPPRGRLQDYRQASADQYGQFQIRGVAPGKYSLVAWLEEPPCDVYDPDGLDACPRRNEDSGDGGCGRRPELGAHDEGLADPMMARV